MNNSDIKKLIKILSIHSQIIETLDKGNLVLGGTNALLLHGLELGREATDVDLIIYQPTFEQKSILELIQKTNGQRNEFVNPEYQFRVTKLKDFKGKFCLDIIITDEELPKNLLSYSLEEREFKVQSISNVIKAKASYLQKIDNRGSSQFISEKDARDLQMLKNLNFNL